MAAHAHAHAVEEPILSRLNRLDNILKQLEDIKSVNHSPKSSYASTTSSGTITISGDSTDFSPKSLEKYCRPVGEVMMEVERKGTLIERLVHAEDRILKMCLQLEEELESEKSREQIDLTEKKSPIKKGLKKLVKSCVTGGKVKHKDSGRNIDN